MLFYSLLNLIANEPLTVGEKLFCLLTMQGIDSLWFLPVYVFAEIIMRFLGMINKFNGIIRFLCSLFCLIDYKFFGNRLIELGMLGCIIFILILLTIELGMIKMATGRFALLFGRTKKQYIRIRE